MWHMIRLFIERHRQSLLSLFMLLLLLVSVLAAAWLSRVRAVPGDRGANIVALLSDRGLDNVIGVKEPTELWYLAEDSRGQLQGCLVSVAIATSAQATGMDLLLDAAGMLRMQRWQTGANLSDIRYDVRLQHSSGITVQELAAATTAAGENRILQVNLRQLTDRGRQAVRADQFDAPDNLLPAGLLPSGTGLVPLAASQVLAGGQPAVFSVLPGGDIIPSGDPSLLRAQMTPQGDLVQVQFDQGQPQIYRLGPDGRAKQIVLGPLTYREAPLAEVMTRVPQARALITEVRRFYQSASAGLRDQAGEATTQSQPEEAPTPEPLLQPDGDLL